MKLIPRIFTLFLCVALVASGCVITERIGIDGEVIKTRSIDVVAARSILMLALDAWDLITARIAAYKAQGEDISEPDALQLLVAEARETLLRRGIDFLNREFAQLAPNAKKMDVPTGLMRQTAEAASAETGIPLRMSAIPHGASEIGVSFTFGTKPPAPAVVSPNDEPRRFAAAGFDAGS